MIYFGNNCADVTVNPNLSNSLNNTAPLKEKLVLSDLIDAHFEVKRDLAAVPLNPLVKKRLKDLFEQTITIRLTPHISGKFPLNELLKTIFNEIRKLQFAKNFKPQLKGSKVLDVLGKEYAKDLFHSIGIELSEEDLSKIRNTKKSYDLDLGVWMSEAGFYEREEIIKAVERALFILFRPRSILSEEKLRQLISESGFYEKPANIIDGKSQYLNTSLGSDEFHVEILWIQTFARQEIFCKDSRYIELSPDFFDREDGEAKVTSSENVFKPFIDLIFDLLTVREAETVNKRGLSRLHLEEAQGKNLLNPELEALFFKAALSKLPKGRSIANYLMGLVDFCFRKHAYESKAAYFILYLKMGTLLQKSVGSKQPLVSENDADEYKKCLPAKLLFENELLRIIYEYAARADTKFSDVLTLTAILQAKFPLVEHSFALNVKWKPLYPEKIPLIKLSESESGIRAFIALYEITPSPKLKESILLRLPVDTAFLPKPILGLNQEFFNQVVLYEARYPGEGYARAFLKEASLFNLGVKRLQAGVSQVSSILPWLTSENPVNGFRLYKLFNDKWTEQEKQTALTRFITALTHSSQESRLKFPYEEFVGEIQETKLLRDHLAYEDLKALVPNPLLSAALSPYLYQDRFVLESCMLEYSALLALTPLEQVEAAAKSLSSEKLQLIFSSKNVTKSPVLGRIARVYLKGKIPIPLFFRMIFFFRFTSQDLTPLLYTRVVETVMNHLEALYKAGKEVGRPSEEIAIEVATEPNSDPNFALILLEMGIISSVRGVDAVIPKIMTLLNLPVMERVWKWAVSSSFSETFLVAALSFPPLEERALEELQTKNVNLDYLLSISKSLLSKKAFKPLFVILRHHERQMKSCLEWKSHLNDVYKKWLDEKLSVADLKEGFETFIHLSTPFEEMLQLVLWKLDEKSDPELRGFMIDYLLSNYTLENLQRREAFFNLLLRNLSELTSDELSKHKILVSKITNFDLSQDQEEWLRKLALKVIPKSSTEITFSLVERFKNNKNFKEIYRDLSLQSEDLKLFEKGFSLCLEIGFPSNLNRLKLFKRLLEENLAGSLLPGFLDTLRGWTLQELSEIFFILSTNHQHHALLEEFFYFPFFNPLLKDKSQHKLIKNYINQSQDDWRWIHLSKTPFIKRFLREDEGYQLFLSRLEYNLEMGYLPLVEAFSELEWEEEEVLLIFKFLFNEPVSSIHKLAKLYKRQTESVQEAVSRSLYPFTFKNDLALLRYLDFHLHPLMPQVKVDEVLTGIVRTIKDSDPSLFYFYFRSYLNHSVESLGETGVLREIHFDYTQGGPSYKNDDELVKIFIPADSSKNKKLIFELIFNFLQRAIIFLKTDPDLDNNHLRDFIFRYLISTIDAAKESQAKWLLTFSLFIEAVGNCQKMYVKHMEMCLKLHLKACQANYYPSNSHQVGAYYYLGLEPLEPLMKNLPLLVNEYLRDVESNTKNLAIRLQHALKILRLFVMKEYSPLHLKIVKSLINYIIENDILDTISFSIEEVFQALLPPIEKKCPVNATEEVLREVENLCRTLASKYEEKAVAIKFTFCKVALRRGYLIRESSCELLRKNLIQLFTELFKLDNQAEYERLRKIILIILDTTDSPIYKKLKSEVFK